MNEHAPTFSTPAEIYRRAVEAAYQRWASAAETIDGRYALDLARAGEVAMAPDAYSLYRQERSAALDDWNREMSAAGREYMARTGETGLPEVDAHVANVPAVLLAPGLASPGPEQPSGDLAGTTRKPLYFFLACSLAVGCAVVAIIANSYSQSSSAKSSSAGSSSYSSTVDVLYEVEGTATGTSITMESGTGTVQQNDKAVPLGTKGTKGITVTMLRGHFVYLSAQNTGASGTITCRISVDGAVVSTNTSSGAYAIASCKGAAG